MRKLNINKNRKIIADGAMGTYFSLLTGKSASMCELANIESPEIIRKIHSEYIKSGARLIRTNTFAANTAATGKSLEEVLRIVSEGYRIAKECADDFSREEIYVAADIGPIYNNDTDAIDEYKRIIDTFIESNADLFIFETFSDTDNLNQAVEYIKSRKTDATVIASFALSPDGYTRRGVPIMKIIESMSTSVDIFGLNCGCGPAHMFKLLQNNHETIINKNLVISCMPNAGYASIENNRTVFTASPDYFSEGAAKISGVYSDIIGGCCGTTPEHIRKLAERLNKSGYNKEQSAIKQVEVKNELHIKERVKNNFSSRLLNNEFVIAVEFSPPSHSNIDPLIDGAKMLKQAGADIITLSDSPLARVKMDSVITASRIARSSGIEALPHLCCRDRNVNSLRSVILGAHAEGIRSVLAVTGDLVPESERGYVKPVFNISSSKLMQLINEMNEDVFKGDPMFIGGALNTSAINKSSELTKALRKINNGCRFFLTQPVYSLDAMDLIMEVRKHAKVLVGIMPIVSYRNAMYLKNEVPGFKIPDEIVQKFSPDMSKDEAVETGISLALQLCEKIREHADGFYFVTPFNKAEIICRLIKR